MKASLCFAALFVAAFILKAQQPTPPSLPPGPLLNKAPAYSKWTVTIKLGREKLTASPSPGEKPDAKTAAASEIIAAIQTGKIRHQVEIKGTQIISDTWTVSGVTVSIDPHTKIPQVSKGGSTSADFPGLEWISQKSFSDIQALGGKKCLVFKGKVEDSVDANQSVDAVAYIDLETRLPVSMQRGEDAYTYQFGAAPQTTLTPPPDVMQAMGAYQERMKRLSAGPAREP